MLNIDSAATSSVSDLVSAVTAASEEVTRGDIPSCSVVVDLRDLEPNDGHIAPALGLLLTTVKGRGSGGGLVNIVVVSDVKEAHGKLCEQLLSSVPPPPRATW